jgi:ribosomal protein S18 acetylase RimI-like enzyme
VTEIVIRHLEPNDHPAAAAVAARALIDAATTVATYGDELFDRLALPYADFGLLFQALSVPQIGAFCGGCLVGVAAVTPPGGCVGSFFGTTAAEILEKPIPGLGDPSRARVFWAHFAIHDCPDEHWHVGPVGVEPGFQGRGIGADLIRELCATFDDQERVGWLETDKEANVRFYRAHGFEVVETTTIVGVPTWFMRRDPAPVRTRPSPTD